MKLLKATLTRMRPPMAALFLAGCVGLLAAPAGRAAGDHHGSDHGHEAGDKHDDAKGEEKGKNGGTLIRSGSNSVEFLLKESGGRAFLAAWAYGGNNAIPASEIQIDATLTRPNGQTQRLTFKNQGGALVSEQDIEEPHFFSVDAELTWRNLRQPIHAEFSRDEGKIALSPEQIKTAGIRTATATPARIDSSAQFPGEIKFNADRTAHVVPRAAGVVQTVAADLGQQVKRGDLLATLSSPTLSEMRSEWLAAGKRRELANATYRRELRLWKEGVSAEQDYQQARAALQEAEIAVQNAEQKLRAIGASPKAKDLSELELRAPFDGVVVEKHIALGEALADNASIFTLSDLRTVWAEFVIAPKDLSNVRVGEVATVSSTSFAGKATGKVSYIGSLLGQQTRTATARVTLDNPDMAWRPGLFVTVNVVVDQSQAAVAVASDAIQRVEDADCVFIEVPGGFVAQPVKLGRSSGAEVEVVSGLAPGVRYASENAFILKAELGKASAEHTH